MKTIAALVVLLVVALASAFAREMIARRAPDRIEPFVSRRVRGCFIYRHVDRVDSAYFEVGCAKPLPDSITFTPWSAP